MLISRALDCCSEICPSTENKEVCTGSGAGNVKHERRSSKWIGVGTKCNAVAERLKGHSRLASDM
jgi:hypothetical protein